MFNIRNYINKKIDSFYENYFNLKNKNTKSKLKLQKHDNLFFLQQKLNLLYIEVCDWFTAINETIGDYIVAICNYTKIIPRSNITESIATSMITTFNLSLNKNFNCFITKALNIQNQINKKLQTLFLFFKNNILTLFNITVILILTYITINQVLNVHNLVFIWKIIISLITIKTIVIYSINTDKFYHNKIVSVFKKSNNVNFTKF